MHTNFYNLEGALIVSGETIAKIVFYNAGVEVGYIHEVKENKISEGKITTASYHSDVEKVYINFEVKKSNKLNLNRKDAFLIKNPEKRYSFEKPYILYIHTSLVNFKDAGEHISMQTKHEKHFLQAYEVTFSKVVFKRTKIEKIPMQDNEKYILQEGERFSECYGSDSLHKCVWSYDTNDSIFKKNHINEKGIIKRWFEDEVMEETTLIVNKPYYTRSEKDDYLLNIEAIAEKCKTAGVELSSYQIERLIDAGINITM